MDFWLFSFERYNGILGSIPHNNHSIEVQIMTRFLRNNEILTASMPNEFYSVFKDVFPKNNKLCGSLGDTMSYSCISPSQSKGWTVDSPSLQIDLPSHYVRHVFDDREVQLLNELYRKLYKVSGSSIFVSRTHQRYLSATINGIQFGSWKTRTASSSLAMVKCDNDLFGPPLNLASTSATAVVSRAAKINFFRKHTIEMESETKTHLLVSLSWFKPYVRSTDQGKPITVWYHDVFELCGIYSVILVQFLQSRCVSLIDNLGGESVLFVCPCIDFLYFFSLSYSVLIVLVILFPLLIITNIRRVMPSMKMLAIVVIPIPF